MLDAISLLVAAVVVAVTLLLGLTYYINRKKSAGPEINEAEPPRPRGVPVLRGEGVEPPRRAARNVRARMRVAARQPEEDEEEEEDLLADEIAMPDGKIGAKKRKKLELKAEKKRERERELEEREEKKQRQQELEDRKKKEEAREKKEQLRLEEEEKALKEEKEKKELEEYLNLKASFAIEEEGFDQEENIDETNKFQEFIDYIKREKVVLMEDLASRFKLKTQEAIDRVQELIAQEWLIGVIDERGKFIYITREELESVAHFIRQRGRVSITELVECSNTLINLQPETADEVKDAS